MMETAKTGTGVSQKNKSKVSRKKKSTRSPPSSSSSSSPPPSADVQGILNISARNYENAFVYQSHGGHDISIQGLKDRNGGLHGDEVLLDLKPKKEWTVLHAAIREHCETERDPHARILLLGAKTSDNELFNILSSDEEEGPAMPLIRNKGPPKCRKKRAKKSAALKTALHEDVFNNKPWGSTPVKNDKEWVLDELPKPKFRTPLGGSVISLLSLENKAPPPPPSEVVHGPIQILSPDALDSVLPDPESGIQSSLPKDPIPMIQSLPKGSHPPVTTNSASSNGGRPVVSILSLESLKKEVSLIEGSSTEEKKSKSKAPLRGMRRFSLPEGLCFDIKSVLRHPKSSNFLQKTAVVKKIIAQNHSRLAAGILRPFASTNNKFALFSPSDRRIPRMKIPLAQVPSDFATNPELYSSTLFIAQIQKWVVSSSNYALGSLVESIGDKSSLEVQTKGILLSNEIEDKPFPSNVLDSLPVPFSIPEEEFKKRRDFRSECVFTIDPLSARDLDDALSIQPLPGGDYRVGVHIADVSYFVQRGSALDASAADRATSVYLTDRVIPMLPRALCEDLCSLNPGVPRLTFSVEWVLSEDGVVKSTWFGRSVIQSAVKLAYEHAQDMLDDPNKDWSKQGLPPLFQQWTYKDICDKIGYLQKIALKLRSKREENGSLRLNQPKICFSLNPETGLPNGFRLYAHRHSNRLIEEFMLLANISVANYIHKALPNLAILRRHPPPKEAMLRALAKSLQHHGIHINSSSSKTLSDSLKAYAQAKDPSLHKKYQILVSLLTKPMDLALYFCSGTISNPKKYSHFALNVPLYTHFTSPIRRYPDILVHRLLNAILEGESLEDWKPDELERVAGHCNKKRLDARNASQESQSLFLNQFIISCGPLENLDALVLEVKDYSLDVLIVEMALVQRIYLNYLDSLESYEFSSSEGVRRAILKWKPDSQNKTPGISVLTIFSEVKVTLRKQEDSDKVNAIILRPLLHLNGSET